MSVSKIVLGLGCILLCRDRSTRSFLAQVPLWQWSSLCLCFSPFKPVREFQPWKTNAVPPPQSYAAEPVKKKGPPPGMDMAIKWSNVYEDNGEDAPKAFTGKAQFLPAEEQLPESGESWFLFSC